MLKYFHRSAAVRVLCVKSGHGRGGSQQGVAGDQGGLEEVRDGLRTGNINFPAQVEVFLRGQWQLLDGVSGSLLSQRGGQTRFAPRFLVLLHWRSLQVGVVCESEILADIQDIL